MFKLGNTVARVLRATWNNSLLTLLAPSVATARQRASDDRNGLMLAPVDIHCLLAPIKEGVTAAR